MEPQVIDITQISFELASEVIVGFDAVILLTDHSDFDFEMIGEHACVLIDTRGKFSIKPNRIFRA